MKGTAKELEERLYECKIEQHVPREYKHRPFRVTYTARSSSGTGIINIEVQRTTRTPNLDYYIPHYHKEHIPSMTSWTQQRYVGIAKYFAPIKRGDLEMISSTTRKLSWFEARRLFKKMEQLYQQDNG